MNYRLAVSADASALARLNAAFNGVDDVLPQDVCRSLSQSAEIIVVADLNGDIAGFCCAQVHHSFCYRTPVAEVTEMYVTPAQRRKGIASGMLRFLENELRTAHGVNEIHLLTGAANLPAQAVYHRAGFRVKNEACMVKEVNPNR